VIVCNASPLIALAVLDRIELIGVLFGEWAVPRRVAEESTVDRKPFSERIARTLRGRTVDLGSNAQADILSLTLGRGEAEVIILAEESRCELVLMDDRKGRRMARLRGLRVAGSVGLLLRARRQGLVAELRPLLDTLLANDIRISAALYNEALRLAGEGR
jgi:predicted nucleic acid-binding protein